MLTRKESECFHGCPYSNQNSLQLFQRKMVYHESLSYSVVSLLLYTHHLSFIVRAMQNGAVFMWELLLVYG